MVNRLVAAELEARWNTALAGVADIEPKIAEHDAATPPCQDPPPASFATLATDLKAVWTAPTTDARLKKRIVRPVIREVVADIDQDAREIVLTVHWAGGAHTDPVRERLAFALPRGGKVLDQRPGQTELPGNGSRIHPRLQRSADDLFLARGDGGGSPGRGIGTRRAPRRGPFFPDPGSRADLSHLPAPAPRLGGRRAEESVELVVVEIAEGEREIAGQGQAQPPFALTTADRRLRPRIRRRRPAHSTASAYRFSQNTRHGCSPSPSAAV